MALNGAYEHPKTRRLARTLGVDPWAALGLMEAFWAWVRKAARDGRIDADQWEDVADYLRWRQPAAELANLLVEAKFVDAMDGWWWVHDWDQHADDTTRKALDRSAKRFANGAPSRQWRKGESPISEESSPQVHRNDEKVRVTASARPEPEPVPEPEPAAAAEISISSTASSAATPPPLSERDRGEMANLLQMAMPGGSQSPYNDLDLLRRVKTAMQGATMAELAAALVRYRKTRKPPDGYGFWPMYLQGVLSPAARASLGTLAAPPDEKPIMPRCEACCGSGVRGRPNIQGTGAAVRAAITAGGRFCDCPSGEGWQEYFAMDEEAPDDGPVIQRGMRQAVAG